MVLHHPDDPEDLARAIREVLSRTEAARLGGMGREMVQTDYALEAVAAQAEVLFKEVLS